MGPFYDDYSFPEESRKPWNTTLTYDATILGFFLFLSERSVVGHSAFQHPT
jgi:hypothetical protein